MPRWHGHQRKSWRLAWCFEHCHKAASDEMRKMLTRVVSKVGGEVCLFKKASQFLEWWPRNTDTPVVLLASWREVKPLMIGMSLSAGYPQPMQDLLGICVYASEPKVYEKASAWASTLLTPVSIIHDLTAARLKEFLSTCAGICSNPQLPPYPFETGFDFVEARRLDGIQEPQEEGMRLTAKAHQSTSLPALGSQAPRLNALQTMQHDSPRDFDVDVQCSRILQAMQQDSEGALDMQCNRILQEQAMQQDSEGALDMQCNRILQELLQ
eukprot:TRINITY_DN1385_c0_g1_i4.p1 TRINITY_DN1385_c0_g1~~TRINITY_DN1385_c0_g1_i4.p1  ORF type:complete len:268 (-),score=53.68 TRINITY_DN1385_c0_g1_i4:19-822(-)